MEHLKDSLVKYIGREEIDEIVTRLAKEIEMDYYGRELVLICPLKGSVPFMADLCRKISLNQEIDFVQLSSSPEKASSKAQPSDKIIKDISVNIHGKHVLIVEEIIDAGRTLSFLKNRLLASAPASLRIVTLLDKPARRMINIKPDYVGRTIEDRFVVGYGLDDDEIGRNLPDLYYLKH
jgi:hypoxanthine phosphoribosyltransferase